MTSHQHTFYSDPHIADPIRWIESGEDPMLRDEVRAFTVARRRKERIQLLLGTFLLLLIITVTTPAMREPVRILEHAAIVETGERIAQIPSPRVSLPELSAHAYLVRFAGTQVSPMHQREWKEVAPASLTKLLTAVTAFETLPPEYTITLSKEAKMVGEKMSKAPVGETFTLDKMLRLALIESANDAAYALAEAIEKEKTGNNPHENFPEFLKLARESMEKIGLTHTYFLNPTGLDQEGHLTTAEDLAKLAEYIYTHHPEIWEITKAASTNIISIKGNTYAIESTNELLNEFPALQGGKTGFTDEARGTLILLYPVKPSYTAIIVILGSENRFDDGRKIIKWLEEAF